MRLVRHESFEGPVVMKLALFPNKFKSMQRETNTYQQIDGLGIAPKFLGHVMQDRKVCGILLEYIQDSRTAMSMDESDCLEVLQRFHSLGLIHNDAHRQNFLRTPEGILLIDFESASSEPSDSNSHIDITIMQESLKRAQLGL
jgi:tRNA A-37 threonylcarbamoyl transferase component Bud32